MTSRPLQGDIIIPTYNNAATILDVLRALMSQCNPARWRWRILISDDGSRDTTVNLIKNMPRQPPWPIHLTMGRHRGPAAARNRALAESSADIILFLGADVILQAGALAAHASFHLEHPDQQYAAVGHVRWDPRVHPTPLMEWMTHGGPQNDFDSLLGQTSADPSHYFYGSHLSLKKSVLNQEAWPEAFAAYGWEDLDLGRRLGQKGLQLKPLMSARGLHRHYYSVSDIQKRQRVAGKGLLLYQQRHPADPILPPITWRSRAKLFFLNYSGLQLALRFFLRYSGKRWTTPRLFFIFTTVEYWRGIIKTQYR